MSSVKLCETIDRLRWSKCIVPFDRSITKIITSTELVLNNIYYLWTKFSPLLYIPVAALAPKNRTPLKTNVNNNLIYIFSSAPIRTIVDIWHYSLPNSVWWFRFLFNICWNVFSPFFICTGFFINVVVFFFLYMSLDQFVTMLISFRNSNFLSINKPNIKIVYRLQSNANSSDSHLRMIMI